MRACEADRCEQGATVEVRWCPRHAPADERPVYPVRIEHDEAANPFVAPLVGDPPEYALGAPSITVGEWLKVCGDIATAEHSLNEARNVRLNYLRALREQGMSLGDIAEVTGLTRQRIGQLLR